MILKAAGLAHATKIKITSPVFNNINRIFNARSFVILEDAEIFHFTI